MSKPFRPLALRVFFTLLAAALWTFLALAPAARAQTPGVLDPTFNPAATAIGNFPDGAVFAGQVYSLAIQPADGAILAGGNFSNANGAPRGSLARINPDGSLDGAYNNGGGFNDVVRAVTLQPDGLALVGGLFTVFGDVNSGSNDVGRIIRLNADGTIDPTFVTGIGANNSVRAIALQTTAGTADGRILIGGFFSTFTDSNNQVAVGRVARLSATGDVDTTFNAGGVGADDSVETIAVQTDDKVVIGGAFNNYNGAPRRKLVRLNLDGSLDTSFNPPSLNATVRSVALQPDGKLLVGGDFVVTLPSGVVVQGIIRLNADGTLDPIFNAGTGTGGAVSVVTLQADGSILLGGDFISVNGVARTRVARLLSSGALDNGFIPTANATVRSFAVQADAFVVLGGDFSVINTSSRISIARVAANGATDPTFVVGEGLGFLLSEVDALAVGNNSVYVGGNFTSLTGINRRNIERLTSDGVSDPGFNPGAGADGIVRAIATDRLGGAYIGGDFQVVDGFLSTGICRLNPDGSVTLTFLTDGIGTDAPVRAIAVQATTNGTDGQVVLGGDFTTYNGLPHKGVVRIDGTTGAADDTFNPAGSGADNSVRAVGIQSADNKVVIGGDFRSFNGVSRNFVARLNADGTLDTAFNTGVGPNGTVFALRVQTDGRVVIGGAFSAINGVTRNGLARLNADGSLDTSFNPLPNVGAIVNALSVQADGRVVIGGSFTTVGRVARANVARVNTDGSLDASFAVGDGANGPVLAIASKGNGRTVIGGRFSAVNGTVRNRLAQLLGDTAPGSVQFQSATYSVNETQTQAVLFVTRTGGSAGSVTVDYTTADGSATAPSGDYTATAGQVTFADGDTTPKVIVVPILQDAIAEGTEAFSVLLSNPTNDTVLGTPSVATVSIVDNPPATIQFTSVKYSGREAFPAGSITVAVARTGNAAGAVTVDYSLFPVTAVAGTDYIDATGTLSWADGDAAPKTFVVTIVNDTQPRGDRFLGAMLSNVTGPAVIGPLNAAELDIVDDDIAPVLQFSAPTYSVNEGAGVATITVTRTSSSVGQVRVDYVTSDGTATAGSDYTTTIGTLTFAAGDSSPKSFQIPILNDSLAEGPETINLLLTNATNFAVVGAQGTAVLTINDDDMPSTVQFSSTNYNATASGNQAIITVTRTGGSGAAASVNYAVANGTAVAGTDYAPTSGTLNWAQGDTSPKTFTIPLLNGNPTQEPKTVLLSLASPTGATLGAPSAATLTVLGFDTAVVSVRTARPLIDESGGKKGVFTFTRAGGDLNAPLTVTIKVRGNARAGVDYVAIRRTITFPAGKQSVKLRVTPLEDDQVDGTRQLRVILQAGDGYTVGSPAVGLIGIRDTTVVTQ